MSYEVSPANAVFTSFRGAPALQQLLPLVDHSSLALSFAMSWARLDAFARGQICALRNEGLERHEICDRVLKKDLTHPSLRAVDAVLEKKRSSPGWRGEDSRAGGRPPALSTTQTKELLDLVVAERGRAKVTVPYCRKKLPFLREVSEITVRRALYAAGLAFLRRRRKQSVPADWRKKRLTYCRWLLKQPAQSLRKFAYTDGTTFYLCRGPADATDKRRAALGPCVWRMADGKDGLMDDNIGPSLYAKSQGLPVKIWGFFCDGKLLYHVLPRDGRRTTNMNGQRYVSLVKTKFAKWRRQCLPSVGRVTLVQDYEKCLWQGQSLTALKASGCIPLRKHTKHSPDLNVIETWWNRLKQLLEQRAPTEFETRPAFIRRLNRTAAWLNANARDEGRRLCRGQKRRARAVIKLKGAKCKY